MVEITTVELVSELRKTRGRADHHPARNCPRRAVFVLYISSGRTRQLAPPNATRRTTWGESGRTLTGKTKVGVSHICVGINSLGSNIIFMFRIYAQCATARCHTLRVLYTRARNGEDARVCVFRCNGELI